MKDIRLKVSYLRGLADGLKLRQNNKTNVRDIRCFR